MECDGDFGYPRYIGELGEVAVHTCSGCGERWAIHSGRHAGTYPRGTTDEEIFRAVVRQLRTDSGDTRDRSDGGIKTRDLTRERHPRGTWEAKAASQHDHYPPPSDLPQSGPTQENLEA